MPDIRYLCLWDLNLREEDGRRVTDDAAGGS